MYIQEPLEDFERLYNNAIIKFNLIDSPTLLLEPQCQKVIADNPNLSMEEWLHILKRYLDKGGLIIE